jgi:hypothetical protein
VFLGAALVNVIGDVIAVGLLGAGSWAPAVATAAFALLAAAGYQRVARKCTGACVRFPLAAYAPPALAIGALVMMPPASRVGTSLAIGGGAAVVALTLHARLLGLDGGLANRLPSAAVWLRALAGVRERL